MGCSPAQAYKRDTLLLLFADSPTDPASLESVRDGLIEYLGVVRECQPVDAELTVLIVLFKPDLPVPSLVSHQLQAWGVLRYLHENDPSAWPENVPIEPDDPLWSFSFAGVPPVHQHEQPAHQERRSRNLGPSLVLVIQPREGFDGVGGPHTKGDHIRTRIRGADRGIRWPGRRDGVGHLPEAGEPGVAAIRPAGSEHRTDRPLSAAPAWR